jgi:GAF domain-containing protein
MSDPAEARTAEEARLNRLLNMILETAVDVLEFDAATISAKRGSDMATIAATDERMHELDLAQYETMDGPCIEVLDPVEPIYIQDIDADDDRWQTFREAAQMAGVRTSLSLHVDTGSDEVASSLNLYARRVHALADEQIAQAQAFAAQLAAALTNINMYRATARLAEQLADAMRTRAGIEQAKGMLMAERGIGPEEAFQVLREHSQATNVKLAVVAARLVMDRREGRGDFLAE